MVTIFFLSVYLALWLIRNFTLYAEYISLSPSEVVAKQFAGIINLAFIVPGDFSVKLNFTPPPGGYWICANKSYLTVTSAFKASFVPTFHSLRILENTSFGFFQEFEKDNFLPVIIKKVNGEIEVIPVSEQARIKRVISVTC